MTGTGTPERSVRIQLMIAFTCAALLVYLVLLCRSAVPMISSGRAVGDVLGAALLILPAIGLWAVLSWTAIRTTGGAGTGWHVPTTTPAIAAVRGKP